MNLLLDTNALIWLLEQKERRSLGETAIQTIKDAEVVFASSISVVEIRIKTMIGKLGTRLDLVDDINRAGCVQLDYAFQAADAILHFPSLIRHDPFDRMLLAQAESEGLVFMTADQSLLDLSLAYVIDARM
ncbi:MAG TPA: type II toxin-antitoxin system VapC family toxin [Candidatus Saccharimonadales bacterium]|nr:type II toxin-antitoxin system VapC family toxin [Candidatus Saccharimonadales bacterium]